MTRPPSLQFREPGLSAQGSMRYTMQNVLVVGASGYVGSRLVPRLVAAGHRVTCLARDPSKLADLPWFDSIRALKGDVLNPADLSDAVRDTEVIYYLVHSMASSRDDFAELDRIAARNLGDAAREAGVKRILYLGGLGQRQVEQSLHLKSRHEVGDILRESGVAVTEFRAAVIVGAGSFSFEMIHHLANRLPIMICPRWVVTRTQPISIDDVLTYLVDALDRPDSIGRTFDIGGPEVMTYRDMMLRVAKALRLKRWLIEVPVLTPRLSSYWVGLVTPVPVGPARALIEGLRHETICENDDALTVFGLRPIDFDQAVNNALWPVLPGDEQKVSQGDSIINWIEPSHILTDRREVDVSAPSDKLFEVVQTIGGENGWYSATWLWQIRGLLDELLGGVGLRRGRVDSKNIAVGDTLDFWRVEEYDPGKRLLLRAEMKVPGKAWLEFAVLSQSDEQSRLIQTARFYPRGLLGILYWYGVYPVHVWVFRRMARAIGARALKHLPR